MKIRTILAAFAMAAFIFSCGGNENKADGHDDHGTEMAAALDVEVDNKIDPICNMEMKEGMVRDTIHHNDKLYGFCSKSCKETFEKTPEDYLDKMGN
ncbi:MAG: ATPase P [Moheibacter sp.]